MKKPGRNPRSHCLERVARTLLSVGIHGGVILLLCIMTAGGATSTKWPFVVSRLAEPTPALVGERIEPDLLGEGPVEAWGRALPHPVLEEAETPLYREADREAPCEESPCEWDSVRCPRVDGHFTNASIGIGGSATGGWAGLIAQGGAPVPEAPPTDRESYDAVRENPFLDPLRFPLSTFSVDVDTASYANVRRILMCGVLPPAGAVRIEEMINYFSYDYPEPEGETPFSVVTEVAECPWEPRHRLVHIGLRGRSIAEEAVPARNLVFLLDVSGSMDCPAKLPLVLSALRLLVGQLRTEDRVAIVVYAGASGVVLEPTSGDDRQRILAALSRLQAGGSTNGAQGIRLAYSLAREAFREGAINRVILATDGDFNVGVTNRSDLLDLIEKERESGVFLTVLGVGTGNIQDSQMEMLADQGNGNYHYLDTLAEARKVLVREAGSTLVTIAKDVKIQVEFNPNRVGAYRLIGYENRRLAARDFNDDKKDAGEIGAGHTVTALYEIAPPGECPEAGKVDSLAYQAPPAISGRALADEILTLKLRYKPPEGDTSRLVLVPVKDPGNRSFASASEAFRFSAAVALFGLELRKPGRGGGPGLALAADLAHAARGEDTHGYRREFVELAVLAAESARARRE